MIYLSNLKMCFPNSLPIHDFTRSPNSSEILVSIHFSLVTFQQFKLRIKHMNLTVLSDASESECWKVILHPDINFVRWSCDHNLTNNSRE